MATWFLGARLTEGTLFLVAATALLALLAVGEAPRSTADASLGVGLGAVYHYAAIAGQTVFSIGAALMSWLLLVSGRVPAWLAVWGLAAPLLLAAGLLLPFTHDPSSPIASALYAPMAPQEIVLAAGWPPGVPAPSRRHRASSRAAPNSVQCPRVLGHPWSYPVPHSERGCHGAGVLEPHRWR